MACNSNTEIENDNESLKSSGNTSENCNDQKQLLSDSISATSRQNGEQAGCEDEQMSEQDASERRKSGMMDFKTNSASPSTLQRPAEELPRRNFQIPRKIKEKKGLFQNLSPESREFDELIKLLSSFYLEPNSRGTFTYTKARLIHNELLEKEFIEKKRELRQNGRSDAELEETYGFLLPDKDKVQTICEKGLFVGHSRVNTLGSPAKGVYLSRYSDLLQMNPFEPGTTGDIIVFKIMKGKLKTIYETGPKNIVDPTQKFDCHVSKNGSKVASLYSYRAFEHTQQYLFEFAFEELKSRPRHVYPYAVLSFQYRGRDTGPSLNRLNHPLIDSSRGTRASRRRYTVWSGTLVNKGEELFQISVRSSNLPLLPFRLPDRLDINTAMNLDEMKKKLPALLSWDTFYGKREVLKYGMYCSLFEVVSRSKPGNHNLAGLLQKLERDKIVLVKPLLDKGFLFLISSTQMQISNERRNRMEKGLHALFIFQDPRLITRFSSTCAAPPPRDPADGVVLRRLEPFLPALHHALLRLRAHPPKDLSIAVERQATDYLSQLRDRSRGPPQPFRLPEYRQHLDERPGYPAGPRPRFSTDTLRSYLHAPSTYQLPTAKATSLLSGEGLVPRRRPPPPPSVSTTSTSSSAAAAAASSAVSPAPSPMGGAEDEHSPVSDWGSQERVAAPAATVSASGTTARAAQSNGGSQRASLRASLGLGGGGREGRGPQYERDKMEKLLQLIHMHKRTLQEERDDDDDSWAWDAVGLKRRLEDGGSGQASKYLRTGLLSNGEPGRASCSEEAGSDDSQSLSLSMVMDSIGICDTDLRERMGQSSSSSSGGGGGSGGDPSVQETHRLLKLLMSMLNRAIVPGATGAAELAAETLERVSAEALGLGLDQVRSETSDLDLRARAKEDEPPPAQEYLEDQTACSMSSMDVCSPASPGEPMQLHQPPPSASSSSSQPPELWSHPDKAPLPVVPDPLSGPGAVAATSDPSTLCQSLDTIIQDEFQSLSSHIKHLMDSQAIMYAPPASAKRPDVHARALRPGACFSTFVSRHVKPPGIQSYMNTLRDRMGHVVSQPWTAQSKPHPSVPSASAYREHTGVPSTVASSAAQTFPFAPAPTYAPSGTVTVSPASTAAVPSSGLPPPGPISAAPPLVTAVHLSPITPPQATPSPAASIASEAAAPSSSLGPAAAAVTTPVSSFTPPPAKTADPAPRKKSSSSSSSRHHRTKESHKSHASERSAEGKSTSSSEGSSTPLTAAALAAHQQQQPQQTVTDACSSYAVAHPTDSKSAANSLISQIKPDIFLSLVQMVQKNTLKFYIHVSDEDAQNQLCTEIKDYLKSFGNVECNPQSFLENNNTLDKFLVIIQNEDIAMHVDKIPALVSLKKLPSVSFAGVDSLDDVKNRTYNELFVSGGLIVSDELILNPELMTLDKLQRLLKFLEEQSSIWQWKVHCKTQKKLKELSRLNTDTMNMLNLLTLYQKKHLVEFLPYHECDAPTRMAPDLECLTKLQASHTQHRHIIFLTALPGKRKHEMWPQFSNRGIVVASMQEVLEDFTGILSYTPDQMDQPAPTAPTPAPPTAPPPSAEKDSGANDECVQEEDMSLDSEDETTAVSAPDTATTTTTTTTTAVAPAATAAATAATAANSTNEQPPQEPSPMQPPPPPQVQDFQPPIPPLPEMPPVPEMPPLPDAVTAQGSPMSYGSSSSSKMDFPSSSSAFASSSSGPEPVADSLASSFGVNPHQSYLCPGPSQWSPFSGFSLPSQPSPVYTPYPHQSPTVSHASQPPVPAEEPSSGDVTPAVPPPLPDSEANNMGVPPTQTTAPPVTQNSQDGSHETQGTAMEPALVSYPIKSAMEPALVSYPIKPSMEPIGLPSLPPEPTIPPPPPGLHLAYGYGWGGDMTATQQQYGHMGDMSLVGMDVGMAEPTDVTGAAESMWAVGDLSGLTPQTTLPLNMPMSVSATPPGTPYLHSGEAMGSPMAEKNGGLTPSSSVGPNSQYIRTPLSSGPESHQSPAGRGGLGPRTLLSPPGPGMGPQGRGGGGGPRHGNHMGPGGYNNRGGMSGPSDMGMRGGFRGRAAPPMPRAMSRPPAPMRGHMRGGPQSPWGAPVRGIPPAPHQLQDYYSDYGYN